MWTVKSLMIFLLLIFIIGCKENNTLLQDKNSCWIAFSADREGKNLEIYLMNLREKDLLTRLTYTSGDNCELSWSPDGERICFTSTRDGNNEIYVMDADGKNQTRLTNNRAMNFYPRWSPSGEKILFNSKRDGNLEIYNLEIYIMDADGKNQENLTNNPARDLCPSWSPDGKKIIFCSDRNSKNDEIYIMDVDSKNVQRLTYSRGNNHFPKYSPDGKKIVFTSDRDSYNMVTGAWKNYEIYVMDADGKNSRRLTKSRPIALIESQPPTYYPMNTRPSWSPDGKWIIFMSQRDGNDEIYMMDVNGKNLTRLTNHPSNDWDPVWRPIPKEE